ncbi:MAG: hypothetical protein ACTSQY_01050 [Candidatus Odinarchaeia archaeon]
MNEMKCSVVNCQRKITKDECIVIDKKVYCRECAVLLNKMLIEKMMRGV